MSGKDNREKLLLIDAYSLFHRAFYALPGLTTSRGEPTGAVFGVASMLLRLLDEERPDYVVVAFDAPGPTFRHETFAEYKGHRPPMPDELRAQMPVLRELVEAMSLPVVEVPGYEADDIIGTLAETGKSQGKSVLILTGDKDALQLVDPDTEVLLTRRGITDLARYDAAAVRADLGVEPQQVVDWKALVGDKSDNIPGVPGIGAKTATGLLQTFGTVEELLSRVDEVKGKTRERLIEHRDALLLSKKLARIERSVPMEIDWQACRFTSPLSPALLELFTRLEMVRLIEDARKRFGETFAAVESAWGEAEERRRREEWTVRCISEEDALAWSESWRTARGTALVLPLLNSEVPVTATRAGVVLARRVDGDDATAGRPDERGPAFAIDVLPLLEDGKGVSETLRRAWREGVAVAAVEWVAHDAKALAILCERAGLAPLTVKDDLLLASYMLNPGQGSHSPADVVLKHADRKVEEPVLLRKGRAVSWEEAAEGIGEVVSGLWAARKRIMAQLAATPVEKVYREIELPLVEVLAAMERRGIAIDTGVLAEMSRQMAEELSRLTREIYEAAGVEFNINSPKQLAEVLFDRLGLPVLQRTKTGPSTNADVLEELADQHVVVSMLLEYRQAAKLKSTYVDALPAMVYPLTGRVHTTFKQAVAATGRLSSMHPNLQNIPIRTDAGRQIRKAFVPGREEEVLLAADYSQIELRVLAHMSGDEGLIDAFRNGKDIHVKTASEIFGVPEDRVTPRMRNAAKAVNFGIVYGISSFGLARDTGLTRKEAQAYIDAYFERYPGVKRFMEESVAKARERGYAETLAGRRRWISDLNSRNYQRRSFAERTAMNTPIQGSAADIIKLAMIEVHRRILAEGLRAAMVLQVHDELLFEVHRDDVDATGKLVRSVMENAVTLAVPLVVDLKSGPNWLEMEALPIDA